MSIMPSLLKFQLFQSFLLMNKPISFQRLPEIHDGEPLFFPRVLVTPQDNSLALLWNLWIIGHEGSHPREPNLRLNVVWLL